MSILIFHRTYPFQYIECNFFQIQLNCIQTVLFICIFFLIGTRSWMANIFVGFAFISVVLFLLLFFVHNCLFISIFHLFVVFIFIQELLLLNIKFNWMKYDFKTNMYHYLRYNLIDPSVSPSEFLATHLNWPKSSMSTSTIVNFITTLYTFSNTSWMYLLPKKNGWKIKDKLIYLLAMNKWTFIELNHQHW